MEQEDFIGHLLEKLFDDYKAAGLIRRDYNDYIDKNGFSPKDIKDIMDKKGLLRLTRVGEGFIAAISEWGIKKVDSNFFAEKAKNVLDHAKNNNNKTTIGSAITLPNDGGGMAKDIGYYIKARKLAITQPKQHDVAIFIN